MLDGNLLIRSMFLCMFFDIVCQNVDESWKEIQDNLLLVFLVVIFGYTFLFHNICLRMVKRNAHLSQFSYKDLSVLLWKWHGNRQISEILTENCKLTPLIPKLSQTDQKKFINSRIYLIKRNFFKNNPHMIFCSQGSSDSSSRRGGCKAAL